MFDEKFLYTGRNLRVVCMHECDVENTSDFNKIYFAQDADKANNQYALFTVGDITDVRYRTGSYYPVAKFYFENAPTVRLSESKIEFMDVEIGKTYTKEVTVTAANLTGDIFVSDPASSDLTVSPSFISKEDAESGNVIVTITLTPSVDSVGEDAIEFITDGGEAVKLPVSWNVTTGIENIESNESCSVEVFDLAGRHVGEITNSGNLTEALRRMVGEGVYLVKTAGKVYKLHIKK